MNVYFLLEVLVNGIGLACRSNDVHCVCVRVVSMLFVEKVELRILVAAASQKPILYAQ